MLENFFKKGKILKNVLQKFHYLQKKPAKLCINLKKFQNAHKLCKICADSLADTNEVITLN